MIAKKLIAAAVFGLAMSVSAVHAEDLTIAVVGPMTGQLATIGADCVTAVSTGASIRPSSWATT